MATQARAERHRRNDSTPIYRGRKDMLCPSCGQKLHVRVVLQGTMRTSGLIVGEQEWIEAHCCLRTYQADSSVALKGIIDERAKAMRGRIVWL